jgi:hypothetical protein
MEAAEIFIDIRAMGGESRERPCDELSVIGVAILLVFAQPAGIKSTQAEDSIRCMRFMT